MNEEILNLIKSKGLLFDKEIFELINNFSDEKTAKTFIEQIERVSGQKFINKNVLSNNIEYVQSFMRNLDGEDKNTIERVFVKLGISLEIKGNF